MTIGPGSVGHFTVEIVNSPAVLMQLEQREYKDEMLYMIVPSSAGPGALTWHERRVKQTPIDMEPLRFYFDFATWRQFKQLVAQVPDARRRAGLQRLVGRTVPLRALGHAVCYFLDGILFPGLTLPMNR